MSAPKFNQNSRKNVAYSYVPDSYFLSCAANGFS